MHEAPLPRTPKEIQGPGADAPALTHGEAFAPGSRMPLRGSGKVANEHRAGLWDQVGTNVDLEDYHGR